MMLFMSIHVSACAPIDFDEGNDGITRDFSYENALGKSLVRDQNRKQK